MRRNSVCISNSGTISILIAKVSAGGSRGGVGAPVGGGGWQAAPPLQYRSRLLHAAPLSSADQSLSSAGTSLRYSPALKRLCDTFYIGAARTPRADCRRKY
ncbi:hypothetical protein SFRURICE_001582 [Spodoptera frugiperda]|nr:hypothetical protein SFRURICE_001582 [Spodoptera frugiperda]